MLESVWGKGKLPTPLVGMYVGTVTMENRKKKVKIELHLIQKSNSRAYIQRKPWLKRIHAPQN